MEEKIKINDDLRQDKLIGMMLKDLTDILAQDEENYSLLLEVEKEDTLNSEVSKESFRIHKMGDAIRICGGCAIGLAYGIQSFTELSLAERKEILYGEIEYTQKPEIRIRGVDKFIMNSDDEIWWMDVSYWENFIRRLAVSRINRLCLVTGFDTEYMSPPYVFFVDVEGYENVRAVMKYTRAEYIEALRSIGRICHDYHMEFSFAVWQQQPWQRDDEQLVFGLEEQDTLCDYCCKGVQKLLWECPEIDVIHFRVNHESGVGGEVSAQDYWLKQIDSVGEVNRAGRKVKLELRAKGMTDTMVEQAEQAGLPITVSTKYCCEHAGLPHHLTRMRTQELNWLDNLNMARRYSYSDLLRKPRNYEMLYRLWCNGSTDLFTWGDPVYVRKFVRSMKLGDAVGFEVIPPLTLKGGREFDKHAGWKLFDDLSFQPPQWEDDRYWLFYTLYGRIGYCSDCDNIAWEKEMRTRLGSKASLAMELIATSSKVVPFITGFHFPEHPQLWYWPELSTGAALFASNNYHPDFRKEGDTYQEALPCDEGLFYSIADYVRAGEHTDGRYTPYQICQWLKKLEEKMEELLNAACGLDGNWEWKGILLDAKMLRELAGFHRNKLLAALGLSFYLYQENGSYLQEAVKMMRKARKNWESLSNLGEAYHKNLLFGAGMNCHRRGSWKDYLPEIDRDLFMLEELYEKHGQKPSQNLWRNVREQQVPIKDNLPKEHKAGEDLVVEVQYPGDFELSMRYRHTNQLDGEFARLPMKKTEKGYICILPGEYLTSEWDILVYFEAVDENGDGVIWPGIEAEEADMPYKLIQISGMEQE